MEDAFQGCGNGSSPPLLEIGPFIAGRRSGGALLLPQRVRAEPGRQTVFGEFQAENLAC